MFSGDAFRSAFLNGFGVASTLSYGAGLEAVLNRLADHLEAHLDVTGLLQLAR